MLSLSLQTLRLLSAGMLLTFTSSFGQTFFISVFANNIRSDFHLSHGAWGDVYMIGTLASGFVMLWAGGLVDVYRVRIIGSVVLVLLAVTSFLVSQSTTVMSLIVLIFALRLLGQGMPPHIATVAMARWFPRARGRAIAYTALGVSFGEAVLPVAFVFLMTFIHWREAWLVASVIVLCTAPIVFFLLRSEPAPRAGLEQTESSGMSSLHWTRSTVLRHPLFWMVLPTVLGPPAFSTSFFFLQTHFAQTKAWTHLQLVSLFPFYTAAALVTMIVSGVLIDRIGTARLMPLYTIPLAAGFLLFSQASSLTVGAFAIILIGVTTGMQATVVASFWAEFYGTKHLGSIRAVATAAMVVGTAIGPGITGRLIDSGIVFSEQMNVIAIVLLCCSCICALGVSRYHRLKSISGT